LKERRRILDSVIERLRQKFNISVAQLDRGDQWNHTVLGVAAVGNERRFLDSVLTRVLNALESDPRLSVVRAEVEID
jgi:uncharacterized protein YlxP (DUF503 family)